MNKLYLAAQSNDSAISGPMPPGRFLIDVKVVALKYDADPRSIVRWADGGIIPYGIKLSALRKWDADEIDAHIAAGCPRVRPLKSKGGGR